MNNQPVDERQGWTSASNAQADALCPGRHNAQRGLPSTRTKDAEFGDRIHNALCRRDPSGLSTEERDTYDLCERMEEKVVREFFGRPPDKTFLEERFWVTIKAAGSESGIKHSGRVDRAYIVGRRGFIPDFKSLYADTPDPTVNLQLRDLAVLFRGQHNLEEVGVTIVQPRVTMEPTVTLYNREALARSEREMFARVTQSNNPTAPRNAGEVQCQFCRARMVCAEYNRFAGAMVPAMLSILDVPVQSWSPEQRAMFCSRKAIARKWLDEAEDVIKTMLAGDPSAVPGWRLKTGAVRETVKDPQACFDRFSQLGGKVDQFMACIQVTKTKLREQVSAITGARGGALDKALAALLDGITDRKQSAPSLVEDERS